MCTHQYIYIYIHECILIIAYTKQEYMSMYQTCIGIYPHVNTHLAIQLIIDSGHSFHNVKNICSCWCLSSYYFILYHLFFSFYAKMLEKRSKCVLNFFNVILWSHKYRLSHFMSHSWKLIGTSGICVSISTSVPKFLGYYGWHIRAIYFK